MKDYIIFNPDYILKSDNGRVLMLAKSVGKTLSISSTFETIVHPIHAMILSLVNGTDKGETIEKISNYLRVDYLVVDKFINRLLNNEQYVTINSKDGGSSFPPRTIISVEKRLNRTDCNPELFRYDKLDLRRKRHSTPTDIVLMLTTRCKTNCFYCYADRRNKMDCAIPFDRIKELVIEARKLNMRSFDLIGGEFFLYEHWKELLIELHNNNFYPYLSTKIPLDEAMIKALVEIGVKELQVSLDTLISQNLIDILKVSPSYIDKIKDSLLLLEKYNIKLYIHTVISSKNDTDRDMASIFEFISRMKNILEWKMDVAGKSMYLQEDYKNIAPSEDGISSICAFKSRVDNISNFFIKSPSSKIKNEDRDPKSFFERGLCSGNYSGMFILPDGNVTICEELYWNETFFIGNVLNQGLEEIWNSQRALKMFYLEQKTIPHDSLCSSCNEFEKCRSIRQVCYKEIIKEFGASKWYYPDLNCPKLKLLVKENSSETVLA